jgi:hypothetical protein
MVVMRSPHLSVSQSIGPAAVLVGVPRRFLGEQSRELLPLRHVHPFGEQGVGDVEEEVES